MSISKILIDVAEYHRLKACEKMCHEHAKQSQAGRGCSEALPAASVSVPQIVQEEQTGEGNDGNHIFQEIADNVEKRDNGPTRQDVLPPITVPMLDSEMSSDREGKGEQEKKDEASSSASETSGGQEKSPPKWWVLV